MCLYAVPSLVCRPLCDSSAGHAEGPTGSSAVVSPPSLSPGARSGLTNNDKIRTGLTLSSAVLMVLNSSAGGCNSFTRLFNYSCQTTEFVLHLTVKHKLVYMT